MEKNEQNEQKTEVWQNAWGEAPAEFGRYMREVADNVILEAFESAKCSGSELAEEAEEKE